MKNNFIYNIMNSKKNKRYSILKKISKNYIEKISDEEPKISSESEEPKDEDYQWANQNNKSCNILKQNFIKYNFNEWDKIIKELKLEVYDEQKVYQETVNEILKKNIFANENFMREEGSNNIFKTLLELNKIDVKNIEDNKIKDSINNISPDFIVININKDKFLKIFSKFYMFRYDVNFIKLDDKDKICIIGETKNNPSAIKSRQRNRYFDFCKYMNNSNKNIYYITLYIFNTSYRHFFLKNFYEKNPCIIGYIPQLYKEKYLQIYNKIIEENKIKSEKKDSDNKSNKKTIQDKEKIHKNQNDLNQIEKKDNDSHLIITKENRANNETNQDKEKIHKNQNDLNQIEEKNNNDSNLIITKKDKSNNFTIQDKAKMIEGKSNNENSLGLLEEEGEKSEKTEKNYIYMNIEELKEYQKKKRNYLYNLKKDLINEKQKMHNDEIEMEKEMEKKIGEMKYQLELKKLDNNEILINKKRKIEEEETNLNDVEQFLINKQKEIKKSDKE